MNSKFALKPVNQMLMGKYKDRTFEEIYKIDPAYLKWYMETTDPADLKNDGKYAKQNQARIKYIKDIIAGNAPFVSTPTTPTKVDANEILTKMRPIGGPTIETVIGILEKMDEKLNALIGFRKIMKDADEETYIPEPSEDREPGMDDDTV